jgi:hypothetical protein
VKRQSQHRYPQTLVSFQHLEGGSYGTLAMIARDRDTLEVQLGNDFVRINADGASQIAQALEVFAGMPNALVVEVEEEAEAEAEAEIIVEPPVQEPRLARPKKGARRRHSV